MQYNKSDMPPPLPRAGYLTGKGRIRRAVILLLFVGAAFFLLFLGGGKTAFPQVGMGCFFHNATGLPCGMCGGTRAAQAMFLHGDFARAWHLNPLAVIFIVGVGGLCLVLASEVVSGRRILPSIPPNGYPKLGIAVLVILVVWAFYHAGTAFVQGNHELVNFKHPFVRWLKSW